MLKQRVPDAFKDHGASETFSGLRFSNGTGPEAADTLAPIAAASPAYKPAKRESDNVIDLREKALVPRRERETAGKQTSKPAKGDARRRPGGGGFRPQNHIR